MTIGETYDADWEQAPDWAKWKAQDADGTWKWFSTKPKACNWGLYVVGTFKASGKGREEYISTVKGNSHYFTTPNTNWRKTITKRKAGD